MQIKGNSTVSVCHLNTLIHVAASTGCAGLYVMSIARLNSRRTCNAMNNYISVYF